MAYYKSSFLTGRREEWLRQLSQVQVKIGSTWYTGEIQTKELSGTDIVIVAVFSVLENVAGTIIASRIIDITGAVAAEQAENIAKVVGQGAMIKIVLPIIEDET